MIRKYLICGKNIHIQSKHNESYRMLGTVHELLLPVRVLWDIEDIILKANGKMAAGASEIEVEQNYRQIYRLSARFALYEVSRQWLLKKGMSKP